MRDYKKMPGSFTGNPVNLPQELTAPVTRIGFTENTAALQPVLAVPTDTGEPAAALGVPPSGRVYAAGRP